MGKRNYTILDNYGQALEDFDIVVSSACRQGCQVSELGVYYGTGVFELKDFENTIASADLILLKKNTLWNTGRNTSIVNRVEVEAGTLTGEFKMKNVIKLSNPTEELMDFRVKIITLIESGKVAANISRKLLFEFLDDAKGLGYI